MVQEHIGKNQIKKDFWLLVISTPLMNIHEVPTFQVMLDPQLRVKEGQKYNIYEQIGTRS